jgi:enoyl-CoA hydratase
MALVLRQDHDGVTTLTLNRADALNALSPALFVELREHLEAVNGSSDTGVVVLIGDGRSFSAGNDLKAIQAGERAPSAHFQAETLDLIESMPQVVMAAVRGHCYTGALELAIACDLLICGDDARFCDTHGRYAMVPTWGMITRLPERVGPLAARDMMYSGRVVGGEEAAAAWAAEIAANSWHTLEHEKRMMRDLGERTRADGLRWGREEGPGAGPDMLERIRQSFGR